MIGNEGAAWLISRHTSCPGVPGKLKSTDGVYGIRFAHNTDATVTGLTMTKN